MDASEDTQFIIQRSSAKLLADFTALLFRLLYKGHSDEAQNLRSSQRLRQTVKSKAVERTIKNLEPFQEWPQLLDPKLSALLPPLTEAFLAGLGPASKPKHGSYEVGDAFMPLRQAICKVLYTFCKIRGAKVISRFFSNEPRYLEPMVEAFEAGDHGAEQAAQMSWEEKYLFQLWLNHLALAPFDLSTIGGSTPVRRSVVVEELSLPDELPPIAARLMNVALNSLDTPGKGREAAVILLARVLLRPDMRRLLIPAEIIPWVLELLRTDYSTKTPDSIYRTVSVLSFMGMFVKSANTEFARPFLLPLFRWVQRFSGADTQRAIDARSSTLARKAVIKVYRCIAVSAIHADLASSDVEGAWSDHFLDDAMGHFLESLADNDTQVRFAASKAISIVTSKLDSTMIADVSEALLESLKDNVLKESIQIEQLPPKQRQAHLIRGDQRRALAAVNGARWHGTVLALAQLLYRRAPPVTQLPAVVDGLLLALSFEQRSSSGFSTGANVRDAACFGVWTVARKYTTIELERVDAAEVQRATPSVSILQTLAVHLTATASCDPSGNIRRGASAALQELVGRHPDTIVEGIQLVQIVDYHAVALRSRALKQVATGAAKLDGLYWDGVVRELLSWQGADAADVESRRLAADALELLAGLNGPSSIDLVSEAVLQGLQDLDRRDVERRHGLMLAEAGVVRAMKAQWPSGKRTLDGEMTRFWNVLDEKSIPGLDITSRTLRPELTTEAVCVLTSALSSFSVENPQAQLPPVTLLRHCEDLLDLCLARQGKLPPAFVTDAAWRFLRVQSPQIREAVLKRWTEKAGSVKPNSTANIGYLRVVGQVYEAKVCDKIQGDRIVQTILQALKASNAIEIKIAALQSLSGVLAQKGTSKS